MAPRKGTQLIGHGPVDQAEQTSAALIRTAGTCPVSDHRPRANSATRPHASPCSTCAVAKSRDAHTTGAVSTPSRSRTAAPISVARPDAVASA
ncbi:hypothetical protein ACWC9T_27625 [Kitasatospora sp. NPDC001159]